MESVDSQSLNFAVMSLLQSGFFQNLKLLQVIWKVLAL